MMSFFFRACGLTALLLLLLSTTTRTIVTATVHGDNDGGASSTDGSSPPLRIYLLIGQSNMEGKGSMKHLEELLDSNATKSTYQHFGTPGNYTKRDDVYIYFQDYQVYQGQLTVGYGMPAGSWFGPELEFGWITGDDYDAGDVLLIKTSWGGKTLAIDFRSPSAGVGNYTECDKDGCKPLRPLEYGYYYRWMMQTIQTVLNDLPKFHKKHTTYEIAGFVWFQGWNDVLDPQKVAEYGDNLAHFIRDVRADLECPNLPVVIGELGQDGPVPRGHGSEKHVALRRQMRSVTEMPEFVGNSRYVMTSPYINSEGERFNGDYHYYGRADTEFYIGRAFGTAMIQLVEEYTPIVRNISSVQTVKKDIPETRKETTSPPPEKVIQKAKGKHFKMPLLRGETEFFDILDA